MLNIGKYFSGTTIPEELTASNTPGFSFGPRYSFRLNVIVPLDPPMFGSIEVNVNNE